MTDFTIEQLEALKEGTAEGPWEWSDHRVPDLATGGLWPTVLEADHDGGRMGDCTLELHIKDEDKRLLAAAPDLVDALIAEKRAHQKLRAEVEGMKSAFEDQPSPHDDYVYAQGWEYALDLVDTDLTRMLAANDE